MHYYLLRCGPLTVRAIGGRPSKLVWGYVVYQEITALIACGMTTARLKQAHWITLLRFAKTTLRDFNNQLGYQGQRIGPDRRPQRQRV